ncbi:MAG TPA: CDP-alcohol phosphatidyltransferase family protein [Polyangiaceae bacterium]|nr:CDP-alcohol phosphatidyltransferase family protein [Polyangiaceae bacterium]
MGFWSGYFQSLKPLSVEEPIDVWVHRPIAYVLAKALMPTPITPNLVTLGSIVLGLASGWAYFAPVPHHMQMAGAFLFSSAVFDCADGQLARMRKSSSRLGRMLDGVADLVVTTVAVAGAIWVLYQRHHGTPLETALVLAMAGATTVTGSFHTTMYDHYKNVYLRLTTPSYREGEDFETALARYRDMPKEESSFGARLAWPVYLFYVKSQQDYMQRFDPFTAPRISALPEYDETRARIYEKHAASAMRLWRGFFGFGSLVFGIALASMLDVLEVYMVLRLVVQNAVYYGYLRPAQRRASAEAFREMGVTFA